MGAKNTSLGSRWTATYSPDRPQHAEAARLGVFGARQDQGACPIGEAGELPAVTIRRLEGRRQTGERLEPWYPALPSRRRRELPGRPSGSGTSTGTISAA